MLDARHPTPFARPILSLRGVSAIVKLLGLEKRVRRSGIAEQSTEKADSLVQPEQSEREISLFVNVCPERDLIQATFPAVLLVAAAAEEQSGWMAMFV